jgi:integrase/recombinase XerD
MTGRAHRRRPGGGGGLEEAAARAAAPSAGLLHLQAYLEHLALERRLSLKTVEAYRRDLTRFLEDCRIADEHQLRDLSYLTLAAYMRRLSKAGLKAVSVARHQSSIRGFLNYLVGAGLLAKSPAAELGRPRVRRRLPRTLSIEEVERLLAAPDPKTILGMRDRALLELLYATGLRVSETTGLSSGALHLEQRYLVCFGKGGKERAVPLGRPAQAALERYLEASRPLLLDRGRRAGSGELPLFLNHRGGRLTRAGVFEILKRHARASGLARPGRPIGPHLLRHAFATHLLMGGADLRVVQDLLGHASITTTQVYTHVERDALREVHSRFHPRG